MLTKLNDYFWLKVTILISLLKELMCSILKNVQNITWYSNVLFDVIFLSLIKWFTLVTNKLKNCFKPAFNVFLSFVLLY